MADDDAATLSFIRRVLEIYGEDADMHGELFWRVQDGQIRLFAMCNDLFWWATSDLEEITPANLPILEQTLVDLQAMEDQQPRPRVTADTVLPLQYLGELFAARARKMRPQQPCYAKMSPEIAALFNACGPERERRDEG